MRLKLTNPLLHFEGSVSNLERYISPPLENTAHYQHCSSSDMLWRLAQCAVTPMSAACISHYYSQGQVSSEPPSTSTMCAKRANTA